MAGDGSTTAPASQPALDASQYLSGDWWGTRENLAEHGVKFDVNFTLDGAKSLSGGLDTAGSTWRSLFDLAMKLDLARVAHIDGATVYTDFQVAQGPNASDHLVGDVQGIDGLDGVPGQPNQNRVQLSQLWYQQLALDGALRMKIGKVDANTEFDHVNSAQEFLNQSAGSSATLFTMPTYPDPAMSINVFVKPRADLQIGFGIYDGSLANGEPTGSLGPDDFFHSANNLYLIGEIDKTWAMAHGSLSGRAGLGGWYSTNDFATLTGGEQAGTGGPYAFIEQGIWRANPCDDNDQRGITLFAMYGWADGSILQFDNNIGGGLAWIGLLESRPDDILGLGIQAVHFSTDYNATADFETSYEIFYRAQLTPWFYVKPDIQYVANPSGDGTPDALALTVRIGITF